MILGTCDRLFWFGCDEFSGTKDFFVLHCIISHFWTNSFNSDAVEEHNILKGACSYILCFVSDFFVVFFFLYGKVEDILCKGEINYFGGSPLE